MKGPGECLAGTQIDDSLKTDLLPLLKLNQAGPRDSVDLDVHVESAVDRGDVTITFPRVEPFYGSRSHRDPSREHRSANDKAEEVTHGRRSNVIRSRRGDPEFESRLRVTATVSPFRRRCERTEDRGVFVPSIAFFS
jgi:hypothetical protein